MNTDTRFQPYLQAIVNSEPMQVHGKITEVIGLLIESTGPSASVGDVCTLEKNGRIVGKAEVVGFRAGSYASDAAWTIEGIHPGLSVVGTKHPLMIGVGKNLLEKNLDGLGNPLDSLGQ